MDEKKKLLVIAQALVTLAKEQIGCGDSDNAQNTIKALHETLFELGEHE